MCCKISIIIPNFNHSLFLGQRLDTIFNQSYTDYEVILLDDASTDDSRRLLEQYKTHSKVSHLVYNKENSGSPFKQWEKGIALAKGDYVWIAESDDFCDLNFLQRVSSHFNSNNGVIYAQSDDVDLDGNILGNRLAYTANFMRNIWSSDFNLNGKQFIKDFLSHKNVIPNASAAVFRKDLVNSKTFDSSVREMTMLGDWLFWIKLLRLTDIYFISDTLNYFRTHDQTSRQHQTIQRKKERLLEEHKLYRFLYSNQLLESNLHKENLYQKWFKLYKKDDILKHEFYNIRLNDTKLNLFYKFIIYKLRQL